jgi:hypothetical protein
MTVPAQIGVKVKVVVSAPVTVAKATKTVQMATPAAPLPKTTVAQGPEVAVPANTTTPVAPVVAQAVHTAINPAAPATAVPVLNRDVTA